MPEKKLAERDRFTFSAPQEGVLIHSPFSGGAVIGGFHIPAAYQRDLYKPELVGASYTTSEGESFVVDRAEQAAWWLIRAHSEVTGEEISFFQGTEADCPDMSPYIIPTPTT